MALSCFLGLRPSEIIGLQWSDFDATHVHIRRSVVRGVVGTCKTPESEASLPMAAQVKLFLNLWHEKSGRPSNGWGFPNGSGKPINLRDVIEHALETIGRQTSFVDDRRDSLHGVTPQYVHCQGFSQ
jgi:integrase